MTRVLVVDNSPDWCRKLEVMLQQLGYGVETAANESEAMSFLAHTQFELALIDVRLRGETREDDSGLSLAMLVAAAGRGLFPPAQDWRAWLLGLSLGTISWSRAHWTIFDWLWMLLLLLAPAALGSLNKKGERTLAGP